MNEKEPDNKFDVPIVDHEYDGIQEFNNPAPFWWQLFFYLSILFSIGYYLYYELGEGESSDTRITTQMQEIENLQFVHQKSGLPSDEEFNSSISDVEKINLGKSVYLAKCSACHTADGGGLVGPNLTDDYWIHGSGKIKDIYKVIAEGVSAKGMPPWGPLLTPAELMQVAVFVKSLQGTRPAASKAPQGEKVN